MVKGLLRLHSLQSHRWLTRARWSIWIIRIRYTMPQMVVMTSSIFRTAPTTLPDQAPFLGGPEDTSLLASYANHVALPLWYNSNNISVIFNCLKLSYATKFKCFNFFYMCFCINIISTFICVLYLSKFLLNIISTFTFFLFFKLVREI